MIGRFGPVRCFDRARRELRKRHHRHLELLGERLHEREISEISVARFFAFARRLHQLKVIDHDSPERARNWRCRRRARARSSRAFSAPDSSTSNRRVVKLCPRVGEPVPIVVREPAGAQLVLIEPPDRAQQRIASWLPDISMLKYRDGQLVLHRDVLGDVERGAVLPIDGRRR